MSRDAEVNLANPTDIFESEYREDELLIAFQPGASSRRVEDAKNSVNASAIKQFKEIGVHYWRLPAGRSVEQAIAALSMNPNVKFAEPNYIVHADQFPSAPNDAMRSDLWGLHNLGQSGGTLNADINAPEAWDVTTGSSDVVIGVIDSGIDHTHPDLAGNIWVNSNETAANGIDDDANGYIDDVRGWDFANNDNDPIDDNGHGTHVAGTIGATGNNGSGVVGVNWNVKMMPLKFLGANGSGDIANAISAVLYAASFTSGGSKVVRITNNSWGGGRKSSAMQSAISNSGSLFVAAAGNGATSQTQYPAGYNNSNVISVAATDHNDNLASFSNFSTSWVDLAAPGVNIISTYRGAYRSMNGTSMASPHVAGVAGLVMAATQGISISAAKAAIMNSVDVLPGLSGKTLTGGRLNAGRAVGSATTLSDNCGASPCSPADVSDLAVAPAASPTSLSLSWTATGDDGSIGSAYLADIRYSTSPIDSSNFSAATVVNGEPVPGNAGAAESFTVSGLRSGTTYHFAARFADEVGNYTGLATASGSTAPAPWAITVVDDPTNNVGFYKSIKYDRTGSVPAIGYSDDSADDVRFARWNGASWDTELVDTFSGPGVSMAFDNDNNPAISYGWGRLLYAQYVPSSQSWQITTLENRNAYNDYTSLAFAPDGSAGISYRTATNSGRGSLKFAKRGLTGWTLQTVATAGARYNSLAYDNSGNPAIAFSDDVNGDNTLDTLKLARWNGSGWNIQTVETGVAGYGVHASLVFDQNGDPVMTHVTGGAVRFVTWNGSSWVTEIAAYGYNSRLAFNGDDSSFYVSYVESDNTIRVARRNGPGDWVSEAVDFGNTVRGVIDLAISPCGTPAAAFSTYPNQELKFATDCTGP